MSVNKHTRNSVVCSCCAEKPKAVDWAARVKGTGERARKDCAAGKHWLGLNPDLTSATRCAWDFCNYGKNNAAE